MQFYQLIPFPDKLYSFTATLTMVAVLIFASILIFTYSYLEEEN